MKRRDFLRLSAGVASLPLFNIGCASFGKSRPRQIAEGRKIRVALVGCGGRMQVLMSKCFGEEIVAMVDPDAPRFDVTRANAKKWAPNYDMSKVRLFADFREFLDKMSDEVDAMIIATNQQSHAPFALAAMRRGIHVYVEKPICYCQDEADLLLEASRKYDVVTQAGHHGHSGAFQPLVAEYIQSGALGQVREVWSWSDRFNAQRSLQPPCDPPKGLDWDLWCNAAEMRPYSKSYLGQRWYDWKGFGNGSLGNMGNHVLDAPFWALNLKDVHPTSVEMNDMSYVCRESYPTRETLTFEFPAREGMDPVTLHWFDGIHDDVPIDTDVQYHYAKREWMNFPPIVLELEKKYNMSLGNIGNLFMGEKGILWAGQFGNAFQFVPLSLKKSIPTPPQKYRRLAKGKSHVHEFFDAIREGRKANADFDYGVPLVKTVLMGNLAAEAGLCKIEWDGHHVLNNAAAEKACHTTYRKGWGLDI